MKVLYIGHYREGSGWGQAAIDYILAMDSVGIDVVPRAVKLNQRQLQLPERILELESKESLGCDVCIQHVLPTMLDFNSRFKKNIALYATETSNFKQSSWARKINTMDEAWVINNQMKQASLDSGVDVPIKIIPHASDFSKFEMRHKKIEIPNSEGNFIFYTIADFNRRKNIEAIVRSFHSEFSKNEPVSLLIKTGSEGMNSDTCAASMQSICNEIKEELKIFPDTDSYKEDLIITDYLSEKDIERIHQTCDCFITSSYGEAWCIPAFDAMGFGNTPICSNTGGMADFLKEGGGVLVSGRMEPVTGMLNTIPDMFTAKENWFSIDENELKASMRNIYEMHKNSDPSYSEMKRQGLKSAYEYSHEKIGTLIKEALNV